MRERGIPMSAPMVRALLERRKWQTRRLIGRDFMHQPDGARDAKWYIRRKNDIWDSYETAQELIREHCPYGQPGDGLYVRELLVASFVEPEGTVATYGIDGTVVRGDGGVMARWGWQRRVLPSIHMPRWASRITMPIATIRAERLQEIRHYDIRAEGVSCPVHDFPSGFCCSECPDLRAAFAALWDSINGKRSPWERNDWVWVVEWSAINGPRAEDL